MCGVGTCTCGVGIFTRGTGTLTRGISTAPATVGRLSVNANEVRRNARGRPLQGSARLHSAIEWISGCTDIVATPLPGPVSNRTGAFNP
jgi:hypothetical protein